MRRITAYLGSGGYFWLCLDVAWFPKLIGLSAFVAFSYCVMLVVRRSITTTGLINVLMACCLFIVAAAPVLIIEKFTLAFRIMFTMTAIELLALFWLLKQLPIGAVRVASGLAALGVAIAFVSVYGIASLAHAEYVIEKRAVAGLSPKKFHLIIILRRAQDMKFLGFDYRDQYGLMHPTEYSFDLLIGPRKWGQNPAAFDVETVYLGGDAPPVLEKDATLVDMSPIYGFPGVTDFSKFATVSARPRGAVGPINALDDDLNTAWEVVGRFPMELELEYPSPRTLRGYRLSTWEATERMPSSWEIWVSSNLLDWRRIQETTQCQPWKNAETRHYDVGPAADITGIRLVIKGTDDQSILRLYEFTPEFGTNPSPEWDAKVAQDASRLNPETCRKDAAAN